MTKVPKTRKPRSKNFSYQEQEVFNNLVAAYPIVEDKGRTKEVLEGKACAWQEITELFNSYALVRKRDTEMLQVHWKTVKTAASRRRTDGKGDSLTTSGSSSASPLSMNSDKFTGILGCQKLFMEIPDTDLQLSDNEEDSDSGMVASDFVRTEYLVSHCGSPSCSRSTSSSSNEKATHLNPDVPKSTYLNSLTSESTHLHPTMLEPTHLNPIMSEPTHLKPIMSEPTHLNPIMSEPTHLNPIMSESTHLNPIMSESTHLNPIILESTHLNPIILESTHLNSVTTQSLKINTSRFPYKLSLQQQLAVEFHDQKMLFLKEEHHKKMEILCLEHEKHDTKMKIYKLQLARLREEFGTQK